MSSAPPENGNEDKKTKSVKFTVRPAVNAAKIDALRSSFESHRSETTERLRKMQSWMISVGVGIIGGLIGIIGTLITLL